MITSILDSDFYKASIDISKWLIYKESAGVRNMRLLWSEERVLERKSV
jgi:hypothetical protein